MIIFLCLCYFNFPSTLPLSLCLIPLSLSLSPHRPLPSAILYFLFYVYKKQTNISSQHCSHSLLINPWLTLSPISSPSITLPIIQTLPLLLIFTTSSITKTPTPPTLTTPIPFSITNTFIKMPLLAPLLFHHPHPLLLEKPFLF